MGDKGRRSQIHAGAAEDLGHAMALHERHGRGIVLRGIEKERTAGGKAGHLRIQRLGDGGVIRKQRTDLAALSTASHDAVPTQIPVALIAKRKRIGLCDPPLQEGGAGRRKTAAVVVEKLIERNGL